MKLFSRCYECNKILFLPKYHILCDTDKMKGKLFVCKTCFINLIELIEKIETIEKKKVKKNKKRKLL